jgi:FkbM family methyltransferase
MPGVEAFLVAERDRGQYAALMWSRLATAYRSRWLSRSCGLRSAYTIQALIQRSYRGPSPATVDVRAFGNASVRLRPNSSDGIVLKTVLLTTEHLPPAEVRSPRTLVDLGTNIGIAAAHMAVLYPTARIIGVELDPVAADLARFNTSRWEDRCSVTNAAAWVEDGVVAFTPQAGREWANTVTDDGAVTVPAVSLDTLLQGIDYIDFMKMDIEGAEREILLAPAEWASGVGWITIEIHAPWTRDECEQRLRDLGFAVRDAPPGYVMASRTTTASPTST